MPPLYLLFLSVFGLVSAQNGVVINGIFYPRPAYSPSYNGYGQQYNTGLYQSNIGYGRSIYGYNHYFYKDGNTCYSGLLRCLSELRFGKK